MTVTISTTEPRAPETWQNVQVLTQSTATAEQSISTYLPVTTLSGGTATGFARNRYVLAAGREGNEKTIVMLATGEAYVRFGAATTNLMATFGYHLFNTVTATTNLGTVVTALAGAATGALVLNSVNDYVVAKYFNGGWSVMAGQATIATST
jgi:hypothetical protein